MKVKELIKKLKKCNQDATVIIDNNDLYLSGSYEVTKVEEYDEENFVEIATDYQKAKTLWWYESWILQKTPLYKNLKMIKIVSKTLGE